MRGKDCTMPPRDDRIGKYQRTGLEHRLLDCYFNRIYECFDGKWAKNCRAILQGSRVTQGNKMGAFVSEREGP